jgi:hypothetical protein
MEWAINLNVVSKKHNPVRSFLERLDSHVIPRLTYRERLIVIARRIRNQKHLTICTNQVKHHCCFLASNLVRVQRQNYEKLCKRIFRDARQERFDCLQRSLTSETKRQENRLHGKGIALVSPASFQERTVPSLSLCFDPESLLTKKTRPFVDLLEVKATQEPSLVKLRDSFSVLRRSLVQKPLEVAALLETQACTSL